MMAELAAEHGEKATVMNEELSAIGPRTMTNATHLKAHRTATSMAAKEGGRGRLIGRTIGGMNTKLHAICDSQ